ncbi:MAG: DUF177 domain-containing protein [Nitrospirales bacterium]|nr:DUF177 domain-containing protein [Nitrospirales bacterium]
MKITVSEIPDEGLEIETQEMITSSEVSLVSPVEIVLHVQREGKDVLLHGMVKADVEQQCSRCLKNFTMTIESAVDVVYIPAEEAAQGDAHELKGDELETGFYKEDILDLDEVARDQLLLNIPMKPLCSPDCKGICPQCGADLSTDRCNCSTSELDPRLAVLKQLLKGKE